MSKRVLIIATDEDLKGFHLSGTYKSGDVFNVVRENSMMYYDKSELTIPKDWTKPIDKQTNTVTLPHITKVEQENNNQLGGAKRFNKGKLRVDLIPKFAQEQWVRVLTYGAEKYNDENWKNGLSWRSCSASLQRHLDAFLKGEDFDLESGELHLAHAMANVSFLLEYYKIAPHCDDRLHSYLNFKKIGLDIDEVIADFVGAVMEKYKDELPNRPIYWNDPKLVEIMKRNELDEEFFLKIEPKVKDLPFEPHCYITSRSISSEITQKWLDVHGFPKAPLYSVGHNQSKVQVAKESGLEIFVDDRFETFVEMNKAGICTYLFDAPHNQRYDVGYKRITDLKQLITMY